MYRIIKTKIIFALQLIIIATLALIGYNNIFVQADAQTSVEGQDQLVQILEESPLYTSVYFRPVDDSIVSNQIIEKYSFNVVQSSSEAEVLTEKIAVIYIDSQMLDKVDKYWLRNQYLAGATVVGINIPVNTLGSILGAEAKMTELRPLNSGFYISMFHHVYDKEGNIVGGGSYSEYYIIFDDIPSAVNTVLNLNGKLQ